MTELETHSLLYHILSKDWKYLGILKRKLMNVVKFDLGFETTILNALVDGVKLLPWEILEISTCLNQKFYDQWYRLTLQNLLLSR